METELPPIYSPRSLDEALELLRQFARSRMLPIRDPETGRVVAVLSRPDALPPPAAPRLGGMATPLGVYLTDGVVSGGAGFWGLFLTGMVLGALALLSQAAVHAALTVASAHGHDVRGWVDAPGSQPRHAGLADSELLSWLPTPLIFVLPAPDPDVRHPRRRASGSSTASSAPRR